MTLDEVVAELAYQRNLRGLSQSSVAERMGVSRQLVASLEVRRHVGRLSMVTDYALALGYRLRLELDPL